MVVVEDRVLSAAGWVTYGAGESWWVVEARALSVSHTRTLSLTYRQQKQTNRVIRWYTALSPVAAVFSALRLSSDADLMSMPSCASPVPGAKTERERETERDLQLL